MKIGLLTSGGDCPGLNAVIRGAVLRGVKTYDDEFVGFRNGWRGVLDADVMELPRTVVRGLSRQGGTILGTSRTNPIEGDGGGVEVVAQRLKELGVDALAVIGGEGSLAGAKRLADAGLPVIGVPKTIDNDLMGTDYTFGFDTAVAIATDAMDRLRTTGESHHRCMVAEVMGRHVGWIALHSGVAAGAHAILIPEQRVSMGELCSWVRQVHESGRSPLVVVAEGFIPEGHEDVLSEKGLEADGRPRLGGIGDYLVHQIEERTGIETRAAILGHVQRGGAPTGYDRVLATRFGMAATDLAHAEGWGHLVAARGTEIERVPLADALIGLKHVPQHRWDEAKSLFGR
ncbi:6-phosphofructokinase [Nocardioides bruguierae]|uniref:6-phosphofructokinase n=1 Tax=Nocardioides bruguierae TaxID=2945102 RepID=UPI002021AD08|nr:6-phosphofructokinase [Nocardioides bruguierae]MCL8025371.1 6-phosphofructokinase [Nocardioides bruguierae]